ncbi:MAG: 30S ribosomal protein S8 [Clostridiaceae bacterium]|nr:30S ribosomal protein S8 [Eubacteriales bacterium]
MLVTDPIADMLTRIRNALVAKHDEVDIPASTLKKAIAEILLSEGYIRGFDMRQDGVAKYIHVTLKYGPNKTRVITGLKRISKPGLRVYARRDKLPKVLNGLGIAILSTSRGIMTDREARKQGIGGEVLAYIW